MAAVKKTDRSCLLSSVTESILSAVVLGAARANEVSHSLVAAYAADESRRALGVPTVEVQEVALTIRFAAVAPVVDKRGADLRVLVDSESLQAIDPLRIQEIQLKASGRARAVVDVQDPKNPKRRIPTLG